MAAAAGQCGAGQYPVYCPQRLLPRQCRLHVAAVVLVSRRLSRLSGRRDKAALSIPYVMHARPLPGSGFPWNDHTVGASPIMPGPCCCTPLRTPRWHGQPPPQADASTGGHAAPSVQRQQRPWPGAHARRLRVRGSAAAGGAAAAAAPEHTAPPPPLPHRWGEGARQRATTPRQCVPMLQAAGRGSAPIPFPAGARLAVSDKACTRGGAVVTHAVGGDARGDNASGRTNKEVCAAEGGIRRG